MQITVKPKNFKLQTAVEAPVRKRVERLCRRLEDLDSAEVILSQQPTHLHPNRLQYVAQITLHTRHGNLIRSEVAHPELLTAVDEAIDHLHHQIERFKSRRLRRRRGAVRLGVALAPEVAPATGAEGEPLPAVQPPYPAVAGSEFISGEAASDEQEGRIVKVKRFSVKPMYPEDAIEEMELLGHSFYVFWNADDDHINVVYRRKDGNYGLIQPEPS
jgi:putative sigma-54 modulation protein